MPRLQSLIPEENHRIRFYADIAIVVLMIVAAYVFWHLGWDYKISEYMVDGKFKRNTTWLGEAVRVFGKGDIVMLLALLFCWLFGNRLFFWRVSVAAAASAVIVHILKPTIARQRPANSRRFNSFPSGDSQVAFAWATVIAATYPPLAAPILLAASGVAIFRVVDYAHYPSDVLIGSMLGYAAGRMAIYHIHTVPRWLYRTTRRLKYGVVIPVCISLYFVVWGVVQNSSIVWTLLIVMPLALGGAWHGKRRSWRRLMQRPDAPEEIDTDLS